MKFVQTHVLIHSIPHIMPHGMMCAEQGWPYMRTGLFTEFIGTNGVYL